MPLIRKWITGQSYKLCQRLSSQPSMNPSTGSWYFLYQLFQGQLFFSSLSALCLFASHLLHPPQCNQHELMGTSTWAAQVILVSASDQVSLLYSTANISSCCHNSPRHLFLLSRSKWTDQAREKPENEITQRRAIINSDFYKLRWNSPPQAHRARWVTPFYNTMLLQLGNKILH